MAVSMKTSAGSDLMLGSTVQSARKPEQDKQLSAGDQFKNLLDGSKNLSSVKTAQNDGSGVKQQTHTETSPKDSTANVADDVRKAVNELSKDERYEKALVALDREISRVSDPGETGGGTASTDVKELAEKIIKGELDFDDIPDDVSAEELIKEIVALMLLKRLDPDKDEDDDKETFDPAVAAVNEQNIDRETSSLIVSELYKLIEKANEHRGEEHVDMLDGISELVDPEETLASAATGDEKAREDAGEGVFEQIVDNMADSAAAEGVPVIQTQAQTNEPTVGDMQNAASQSETENVQQVVQGVEQSGGSDGAQMRFNAETQRTGETSEIENDEEFGNVIESFTVKETRTEDASPEQAAQTANVTSVQTSRVQNASEELEMLKNAKLGKGETETTAPTETATALSAEQPIVFARADGTQLEVDPTAIVDQAQRLIERAIAQAADNQSEYSLVLNPEELGRITVKLIKAADGAVSVTVAAENSQTQRVLEQHSELMQNNLRSNGLNLTSWQTVNESRQETYAQDYNGSSKNPYFRRDDAQSPEEESDGKSFAEIIASM